MEPILIRTAIVTRMESISDIGVVQPYERYAKDLNRLRDLYAWQNQVRGWFVRRAGWRETCQEGELRTIDNRWQIRGYMSLDDSEETELVFDALVHTIHEAFRSDETLGGIVDSLWTDQVAGVQGDDIGPVMFAGVLCHGARLSLVTRHHEVGPGEWQS